MVLPCAAAMASRRELTTRVSAAGTMAVSAAQPGGSRQGVPKPAAVMAAANPPRAGRMVPSKAISPKAKTRQAAAGISPAAASKAKAIGRS